MKSVKSQKINWHLNFSDIPYEDWPGCPATEMPKCSGHLFHAEYIGIYDLTKEDIYQQNVC